MTLSSLANTHPPVRFALVLAFLLIIAPATLAQGPQVTAPPPPGPTAENLLDWHTAALAAIDPADHDARYRIAVQLYRAYDNKPANLVALNLARAELRQVLDAHPQHTRSVILLEVVEDHIADAQRRLNPNYWLILFTLIGGLGVFLLGMKNLSEGVQAVAGTRLRAMINAVSDNRLAAVGIGTGVTCLVQSSSITTVVVVGLVNSGVMLLHQAIGIIMGANIGTTITGWILVLQVGDYGLPILGAAAFVFLFSKVDRWRFISMAAMGLGMIFFGLELMKDGFGPLRDVPAFVNAFAWFAADNYLGVLKCAAVGCILTFIVQSSSATLGITIGLASTGVIPFSTAAALVLGENIGTTITAWLASLGATTNAKRAAYAHVLFNVIGVVWITAIFAWYLPLISAIVEHTLGFLASIGASDWGQLHGAAVELDPREARIDLYDDPATFAAVITAGIAAVHTGFNLANTTAFLPFVRAYARLLERLVPDRGYKETPKLTQLDLRMVESPVLGIEQSRREVLKMAEGTRKMLTWTREVITHPDPNPELVRKIFHREQILDNMQHEVIEFLTDLLTGSVPHAVTEEGREQLRIADEFESVSDYISTLLKSHLRMRNADLQPTPDEFKGLLDLHAMVAAYLDMTITAVEVRDRRALGRAQSESDAITARFKELREAHLHRLTSEDTKVSPVLTMSYNAMLNAYRKIRAHCLNIIESLAGEK